MPSYRALVSTLNSAGLLPGGLDSAFRAVDRAWFIPDRVWCQEHDDSPYTPVDRASDPERWMTAVNSNRVVVTQFDDGRTAWPQVGNRPTCSASMPSAVAAMLRELDVRRRHRVLEIGTGTGYNAALLCELVGAHGRVATVEVDGKLGEQARHRLDEAGYAAIAEVWTADGTSLDSKIDGRFDRVIATAAVQLGRLPYTWVEKTGPGGVIVAPMRTDLASGPLVRFVVQDDGTAIGRATSTRVGFMELRSHRAVSADMSGLRWDDGSAEISCTDLAPWPVLLDENPRWAIAVSVPNCRYDVQEKTGERPGVAWLRDPISRSWAAVAKVGGRYVVRQHGPRRLWHEAESAIRWWQRRGEPPLEDWEWIVAAGGQSVHVP